MKKFLSISTLSTFLMMKYILASSIFHDDNLYILEFNVNKQNVSTLETFFYKKKLYLPLKQFFNTLNFVLTETNTDQITGWFLQEDNKFRFDLRNHTLTIKNKTLVYNAQQLVFQGNVAFIDIKLLEELLGFTINFNIPEMQVNVITSHEFPQEIFQKRLQYWSQLKASKTDYSHYRKISVPYSNFSVPTFNISLQDTVSTNKNNKNHFNYSVGATNHIMQMHSNIFISGKNNDINNIKTSLSHEDSKPFGGFLKAKRVTLGDTISVPMALISEASTGSGIRLSNQVVEVEKNFTTNFQGSGTPGWQVELYRNDVLLDAKTIKEDAEYKFNNIELLNGNNIFKLVFYGPQGQKHETIKQINTNKALVTEGQVRYDMFAGEINKEFLSDIIKTTSRHNVSTKKFSGELQYGLTQQLTTKIGLMHMGNDLIFRAAPHSDNTLLSVGLLTTLLQPLNIETTVATDSKGQGKGLHTNVLTDFAGFNIRARYVILDKFISEVYNNVSRRSQKIYSTNISRSLGKSYHAVAAKHTSLTHDNYETKYKYVTGMSYYNYYLNNTLFYNMTRTNSGKDNAFNGRLLLNKYLGKSILIRGEGLYNLKSNSNHRSFESISAAMEYIFSNSKVLNTNVTRTFDRPRNTTVSASLTWGEQQRWFLTASHSRKSLFLGVGLNVSLIRNPISKQWETHTLRSVNNSTLYLQHYFDKNNNDTFDDGDESSPQASIQSDVYSVKLRDGNMIPNVMPHKPVHIKVANHLKGHATSYDGIAVETKPCTSALLQIPLKQVMDLEGEITRKGNTGKVPLSYCNIILKKGTTQINKTITEFDGSYEFEDLMPGAYNIEIPKHCTNSSKTQVFKVEIWPNKHTSTITRNFEIN